LTTGELGMSVSVPPALDFSRVVKVVTPPELGAVAPGAPEP